VKSGTQLLQGVSEENDKGVVELVESQYYKQECNHHQGDDSLPAQHDNSLQETGTLLQNQAGKLFAVKLFKLEEEEFVLTNSIDSKLRTRNAHAPACYRIDSWTLSAGMIMQIVTYRQLAAAGAGGGHCHGAVRQEPERLV
jgi:hypothetical protein